MIIDPFHHAVAEVVTPFMCVGLAMACEDSGRVMDHALFAEFIAWLHEVEQPPWDLWMDRLKGKWLAGDARTMGEAAVVLWTFRHAEVYLAGLSDRSGTMPDHRTPKEDT